MLRCWWLLGGGASFRHRRLSLMWAVASAVITLWAVVIPCSSAAVPGTTTSGISAEARRFVQRWSHSVLLQNDELCLTVADDVIGTVQLEECAKAKRFTITPSSFAKGANSSLLATRNGTCLLSRPMNTKVTAGRNCRNSNLLLVPAGSGVEIRSLRGAVPQTCLGVNPGNTVQYQACSGSLAQVWQICKTMDLCANITSAMRAEKERMKRTANYTRLSPPSPSAARLLVASGPVDVAMPVHADQVALRVTVNKVLKKSGNKVVIDLADGRSVLANLRAVDSQQNISSVARKWCASSVSATKPINQTQSCIDGYIDVKTNIWFGSIEDDPGSKVILSEAGDKWNMMINSMQYGVFSLSPTRTSGVHVMYEVDTSKIAMHDIERSSGPPAKAKRKLLRTAEAAAGRSLSQQPLQRDTDGIAYIAVFYTESAFAQNPGVEGAIDMAVYALNNAPGGPLAAGFRVAVILKQRVSDMLVNGLNTDAIARDTEANPDNYFRSTADDIAADLICIIVSNSISGANLAFVAYAQFMTDPDGWPWATSVIKVSDINTPVFLHELGHNFGLEHNREEALTRQIPALHNPNGYGPWAVVPAHCTYAFNWCWEWHLARGARSVMSYPDPCDDNSDGTTPCHWLMDYGGLGINVTVSNITVQSPNWGINPQAVSYNHYHTNVPLGDARNNPKQAIADGAQWIPNFRKHGCNTLWPRQIFANFAPIQCFGELTERQCIAHCQGNGIDLYQLFNEPCAGVHYYPAVRICCFTRPPPNGPPVFKVETAPSTWGSTHAARRCSRLS